MYQCHQRRNDTDTQSTDTTVSYNNDQNKPHSARHTIPTDNTAQDGVAVVKPVWQITARSNTEHRQTALSVRRWEECGPGDCTNRLLRLFLQTKKYDIYWLGELGFLGSTFSSSTCCRREPVGTSGTVRWCPSCLLANTQRTDPNHQPGLIFSSSTT